MSDFGLYIQVKETTTFVVTRFCAGMMIENVYHVNTDDMNGRLDARCLKHNIVMQGITTEQAAILKSSHEFCHMCQLNAPAIEHKPDPLTVMLRDLLRQEIESDDDDEDDGGDYDRVQPVLRRNPFAEFLETL